MLQGEDLRAAREGAIRPGGGVWKIITTRPGRSFFVCLFKTTTTKRVPFLVFVFFSSLEPHVAMGTRMALGPTDTHWPDRCL